MIEAFGQMLPFAVGVAISPTPIVAMVLMLITPQARSNGFVFILGWLVGVFAAGMIASIVIGLIGPGDGGAPATWTYWLKLVLGGLLVLLAIREWRARPAPGADVAMPGWMSALDSFTGPRAGGLAILLGGLNPKNLIFIVGAAAALAPYGLSGVDQAIVWVAFTLIATIGVATPLVIYLIKGESAAATLDHLRAWMAQNNTAIIAVLLLIVGAKLIGDAIAGLAA